MLTKTRTIVFCLCSLFLFPSAVRSQDSVRLLREITIEQSRLQTYDISRYTRRADSAVLGLMRGASLAELLRKSGFGGVRGYGPGGAASPSFRGTASHHTTVLWNGINIISPLLGQADLSQLPITFFDDVAVQTGGSASLYGNGAMGATISLHNTARFNEGFSIKTFSSAGSFGYRFQDGALQWSGKKYSSSTRVFGMRVENDFSFRNNSVSPVRTDIRKHNAGEQYGLLQQHYWRPAAQHLLWAKFWFQSGSQEIPNTSFSSRPGEATQQERSYRGLLGYTHSGTSFDFTYQGAWLQQQLEFRDPALNNLIAINSFLSFVQNAELSTTLFSTGELTSGLLYNWEKAQVDAFAGREPQRNRIAFFAAYKQHLSRVTLTWAIREEVVDGHPTPIAPSVTIKAKASDRLSVSMSSARSYRLPTFNDLYWRQAGARGNQWLKPEVGWNHELGLSYQTPVREAVRYSFHALIFSNEVNNWIQWVPMAGQVWSPHNIKQVWSRGAEAQADIQTRGLGMVWELRGQYTFVKATNQRIYDNGNPDEIGKQLMYTPRHEGSMTFCLSRDGYQLQATHALTGQQYTDAGNDAFFALPSFGITQLWLSKAWPCRQFSAVVHAEVNNLFNTHYVSRPGYPMPGIHYRVGVTLQFTKPNRS